MKDFEYKLTYISKDKNTLEIIVLANNDLEAKTYSEKKIVNLNYDIFVYNLMAISKRKITN